jgi:hypothetical protein
VDTAGIVAAVTSHAQTLGKFEVVAFHEPKGAPGSGLSLAIIASDGGTVPAASGLASSSSRVALTARIFKPLLGQPGDDTDTDLLQAMDALFGAYAGVFTLGGLVRNVDLLGAHGAGLSWRAGYVRIDEVTFRIIDINLPMILNDQWDEVA